MQNSDNSQILTITLKATLFDIISSKKQIQNDLKQDLDKEQNSSDKEKKLKKYNFFEKKVENIILLANNLSREVDELDSLLKENSLQTNSSTENFHSEPSKDTNSTEPLLPKNQSEENPNNSKNDDIIKLKKSTTDKAKAIVVTSNQFLKLKQSKLEQKDIIVDRKEITETTTDKPPVEDKENQLNIEEMLEKASNLYKEGKIAESQALYEKISTLNKEQQNKTLLKVA